MSKLRLLSGQYLRTANAQLLLFPLMLLVGCGNTRTEYVPAPVVPIPPQLTADCEQVVIPNGLTFGGAVELLADAMKYIANCNHDKREIREIEQQRQVTK
ncbi:TPA: Rz1-like lysis system protein LysC [Morganella morganii]